jgi:hypothetical protein
MTRFPTMFSPGFSTMRASRRGGNRQGVRVVVVPTDRRPWPT